MLNVKIEEMVISYYRTKAFEIAENAVKSFRDNRPVIDLYDEDFYLENLDESFSNYEKITLNEVVKSQKLTLDAIMLEAYKKAL